jgi:uncharacterized protein YdcH (DUF465 family)
MSKSVLPGVERLDTLVQRHRQWDERIKELGRHAYLTPAEQAEVRELKKLKLAAKDRIVGMQPAAAK